MDQLLQMDDTRLRRSAAKLTHVGEQTGPVSTLVIQSFYYLPCLKIFRSFRTAWVSYQNDTLPTILNFSVTPEEFRRMLTTVSRLRTDANLTAGSPTLSFTAAVDAPEGVKGEEILFSHEGDRALRQSLASALDPENELGRRLLNPQ